MDKDGNFLPGKEVVLTDISDNQGRVLQSLTSDNKGRAIFFGLSTGKSAGVSVDGVKQGYIVRTSQAGYGMAASFTVSS